MKKKTGKHEAAVKKLAEYLTNVSCPSVACDFDVKGGCNSVCDIESSKGERKVLCWIEWGYAEVKRTKEANT